MVARFCCQGRHYRKLTSLRVRHKDATWVLFLDSEIERPILEALSVGVTAILPPSANLTEIIAAVRIVASGLAVFPQKLFAALSGRAEIVKGRPSETEGGGPRLSTREIAVLTAMADGLSNKEIARRLGISFHTVKFHVASILEKLEVDTRTEAVVKAAQIWPSDAMIGQTVLSLFVVWLHSGFAPTRATSEEILSAFSTWASSHTSRLRGKPASTRGLVLGA
jgi:DNA-binding NarL/FixJ family response regulator